ncbi:RDD family protein [Neisseria shayeganii]|uniref:RDD family protein n=1 Tax=Neisseria shayeganii TaxID=607712 RepID=A0A7D7NAC4_9NEIS|nr:RDD family protein [Neisseria shayeganii]QMT41157.1 RDD family protein [Neisseria shayeganii]
MNPTPASFKRRLAALCYESLLVAAVSCVALIPAAAANSLLHTFPSAARVAVSLIFLAAWWLYFSLSWRRRGRTLPMQVWGLQLQTAAGGRPSARQLRSRFIWGVICVVLLPMLAYWGLRSLNGLPPKTAAGLACLWWILPWGFALVHPSRQFLYDFLAGTRLVKE